MRFVGPVFLAYCILEIASLIAMGSWLGFGWTFLLVTATFIIGIMLIRHGGRAVVSTMRAHRGDFKTVAATLVATQLRFAAGILLIIPGFLSDMIAVVLLLPPVKSWLGSRFQSAMEKSAPRPQGGDIIEGEAVEVTVESGRIEGPKPPAAS